ncbi:uncharacterized protein Z518_10756 [Rhinocladiella mackenziei CBS 650.93]|uniref:Uncharacterized protein n=1 Tax=Rhinocladiella mackenziei CBS 650.93 TaxID=1442369 RepID=A0A0D2I251_9EURO|nr:uncharacterized protein Z518_10756 [Rhinocladiella mackenziei CBS 650.93]KIW99828.1 hypothetical protein Z518_10756 [Rhinocladiella mackenziei CBS 650.93]
MASYQTHGLSALHDESNCPEIIQNFQAENEAIAILQRAQRIPIEQQGATAWVGLRAEEIPSSGELMSGLPVDQNTIFSNELAARKYREVLLPRKQQQDETIPQSPEMLRAHVKVLFKAFKCVPETCEDSPQMKKDFINQKHNNVVVECLCWEILRACIERSEKAENLVEAWEPAKFKYKHHNWSFAERFDNIVTTMTNSKTICKHLFDTRYLYRIVDEPLTGDCRVKSNRKLNQMKAEVMKRGKAALEEDEKTATRCKSATGIPEQGSETTSSASPPQRRRRTRKHATTAVQQTMAPQPATQAMRFPSSLATTTMPTPPLHASQSLQPMAMPPMTQTSPGLVIQSSAELFNTFPTTPSRTGPAAAQPLQQRQRSHPQGMSYSGSSNQVVRPPMTYAAPLRPGPGMQIFPSTQVHPRAASQTPSSMSSGHTHAITQGDPSSRSSDSVANLSPENSVTSQGHNNTVAPISEEEMLSSLIRVKYQQPNWNALAGSGPKSLESGWSQYPDIDPHPAMPGSQRDTKLNLPRVTPTSFTGSDEHED